MNKPTNPILLLIALVLASLACKTLLGPQATPSVTPILATEASPPGEVPTQASGIGPADDLAEQPVTIIPLQGPVARPQAELSGLAWYGDYLVLLPQYPKRGGQGKDGCLWALPKSEILAYLDGSNTQALKPIPIPLDAERIDKDVPGFEGFEAIAFLDEQVFLTIEANSGASMRGYLIKGEIAPDLSQIRLDSASLTENYLQGDWSNKSDEAIFIADDSLFTLYELNGQELNRDPHATRFDFDFHRLGTIPFPHIEYRLTDASELDDAGRFWVINFFFTGDEEQKTDHDPLAGQYGEGPTHARSVSVERLVELQYSPSGVALTGAAPIQLQLLPLDVARNWEGLVRLDDLGFLLVTDKFPETILGFVPQP
ncbi:MAG: hypothetical protein JXA78_19130 [Anaerolineales bacterium]|nr:hypothetical protein [Anaerolineales bacterium]